MPSVKRDFNTVFISHIASRLLVDNAPQLLLVGCMAPIHVETLSLPQMLNKIEPCISQKMLFRQENDQRLSDYVPTTI